MDTFDAINLRRSVKAYDPDHRVTDASLLIVLTADLKAWNKSPERYWRNAAAAVVAQRLGFRWDESLSLGKTLAGLNAQSKGRRLGIFKPHEERGPSLSTRSSGPRSPRA